MNGQAKIRLVRAIVITLAMIVAGRAFGQETAVAIDPKADDVLKSVSKYFVELNSYRADVSMTVNMEAQGMKQEMTTGYALAMRRPNLFSMVLKEGMMGGTLVCDGKHVYSYAPMLKAYTEGDAPATLEGILSDPANAPMIQSVPLVGSFAREDPYADIMEAVTAGQYIGVEDLDGVKCHRMKLIQEEVDWEFWVDAGDPPLPRKMVPDLSKSMGQDAQQMKVEMVVTFKDWQVNGDLPPETFAFTPPAGARKVGSFFEAMRGEEEPNPLLGKAAPDFTLALLDGGQVQLATHKGKEIVILDFWATWCGPCVRALPVLSKVAEAYKDKGVVFYAVNQQEDAETIRDFLKEHKLQCTVALDSKGEVGNAYGVTGIPQTVIVGKDGTVQVVHVGFMPGLEAKLTGELDALLEGKNLAAKDAARGGERGGGLTR